MRLKPQIAALPTGSVDSRKGRWDSDEIETESVLPDHDDFVAVERVDGTQMRLKQPVYLSQVQIELGRKGRWDSDEIETPKKDDAPKMNPL